MVAISLAIELLIMTGIGIFIRKINLVQDQFSSQLSAFLMNVSLPCLVFTSMTSLNFSMDMLRDCGIILALSAAVCLLQLGMGQVIYVLTGKSGSGRIARYGLTITHFSFMGIPVIDALFGDIGNLYYAIFLIPVRLIYYGISKNLLMPPASTKEAGASGKSVWKTILSPGLVVMPFAFLFWIFDWNFPAPIANCISSLSKTCSPLGLILCGLVLGKYDFKRLLHFKYFRLPIVRTVIMPLIFFLLAKLAVCAGVHEIIAQITVIYTALPFASLMASFVIQYDPDPEIQFEAAGNTMIATLLSTVTVPIWYFILQTFM